MEYPGPFNAVGANMAANNVFKQASVAGVAPNNVWGESMVPA